MPSQDSASTAQTSTQPAGATAAGPAADAAGEQSLWQYMLEHIDEFPVAKAIVEHFDANPGQLAKTEIAELDMIAVYLRAKVTIKRQQVAWAEAQTALTKAREASKGLRGVARRCQGFSQSLQSALCGDNGRTAAVALAMGLLYLVR